MWAFKRAASAALFPWFVLAYVHPSRGPQAARFDESLESHSDVKKRDSHKCRRSPPLQNNQRRLMRLVPAVKSALSHLAQPHVQLEYLICNHSLALSHAGYQMTFASSFVMTSTCPAWARLLIDRLYCMYWQLAVCVMVQPLRMRYCDML